VLLKKGENIEVKTISGIIHHVRIYDGTGKYITGQQGTLYGNIEFSKNLFHNGIYLFLIDGQCFKLNIQNQ